MKVAGALKAGDTPPERRPQGTLLCVIDVARTPDEQFADLPGFPFAPHYADVVAEDLAPLRMHYLDEGPPTDRSCCCCTASRPGPTCTAR